MGAVTFEDVGKLFGDVTAVENLNLQIDEGEFLVLVGPSGCGKTTTLRMLAGFERPTYGTISIDGEVVNRRPPQTRDLAMVFQNYALYPHMSVYRNLSFGMKVRKTPKAVIRREIAEVCSVLGLEDLVHRRPAELSGGQRQRVALGRALLRRPRAFLMDEPLSNLDAALRLQMRVELKRLHERLETTIVYVTHDQVEAMTMATRIALMEGGRLQQIDTPERLYESPRNVFVAGFIGSPKMNLVDADLLTEREGLVAKGPGITLPLTEGQVATLREKRDISRVIIGVRPEDVRWAPEAPTSCSMRLSCGVEIVEPLGSDTYVVGRTGDMLLMARFPPRSGVTPGGTVELAIDPSHCHIFDARTGDNMDGEQPRRKDPGWR